MHVYRWIASSAKLLINGTTITQPISLSLIDYFHIELEEHDVIWANGAMAETYLDLGNRHVFLEPGVLQFTSPKAYDAKACYPLAYSGPAVDAARAVLRRANQPWVLKPTKQRLPEIVRERFTPVKCLPHGIVNRSASARAR